MALGSQWTRKRRTVPCPECRGYGKIGKKVKRMCHNCKGTGKIRATAVMWEGGAMG